MKTSFTMTRRKSKKTGFGRLLMVLAMGLFCTLWGGGGSPVQASSETGIAWLLEQQQDDGRIAAADEVIAHHATFESFLTLHLLGHDSGSAFQEALQYLVSDASSELSFLVRRLKAAALQRENVDGLLSELARYQNPDGGFSSRPGWGSSLLDTIEALEALSVAGMREAAVVQPALNYLLQRQHADGSFSITPSSPSSVYLTSRTLLVLQSQLFDYNLSGPLQGGADFLLQQHQAGILWGEPWESAQALLALIPAVTDATRYDDSVAALRERQNASGSWDGSVYATALGLRAIYLAEQREAPVVEPETGSITGRVQDAATGLPLAGGRVTLPDTDFEALIRDNGGFELGELPPGEHTVEFGYAGYDSVFRQVRVEAGRHLDMGIVLLHPLLDSGLLRGVVTDGVSGALVPGALVAAVGEEQISTMTGADGGYQLELRVGEVSITVTADGYEPVTVNATVVAGAVLNFSPALLPAGTEPESTLTLRGRVLDSFDGTPIAGALVTSPGPVETLTGNDGAFLLEELVPAELILAIQADGYLGVSLSLLADQGGLFDLGGLRLARIELPETSTIRGTVHAADSGEPIAGALLTVAGESAESDDAGRFVIEGIKSLNFELAAAAPGYHARRYAVEFAEHGRAELAVVLQPASYGGIAITSLTAERPAYPAYSQVLLNAALESRADSERLVRLHLRVMDSQGGLIDEFGVTPEAAGGLAAFSLAPGTVREAAISWYNRHYPPDTYTVWLQVHDAASAELLAERTARVVVEETRWLEYVRLAADPHQANQGASEAVRILLSLRNRSNVSLTPSVTYEWRDPEGMLLHADTAVVEIDPRTISATLPLASLEWNFARAGSYPFKLIGIEGVEAATMEAGTVEVAPDIRIEPRQNLEPEQVLPQGDQRLRMRIRIEGGQAP
ncbi:carboxypeptidase regulatory-like domain-containing protein [Desulfurivibrio dismutans]|uniref:carboxypeptidase regulatory-like domain-containing protein n=1 Tax=Desulfurivibrio dismutans TaxID=1398908 RepID=UPI0023DC7FE0|nr:carboxypeptidase regulatory-like domain-containing protein [Desulfurivibrio alkaliphilus]MDF1613695.1 carboxypeptidase regulatory-like domain-containing protein [Desulfurivibrio alkaliphilus]